MGKMKRIVYIIAVILTVSILVGGVVASADYTGENSTRVGGYEEISTLLTTESEPSHGVDGGKTDTEADDNESAVANGGEADENKSAAAPVEGDTDTDIAGTNTAPVECDTDTDIASTNTAPDTNAANGEGGEENKGTGNPFEVFWDTVKAYATEIFCAMTFVGSLVLAYAYKCGLIPIIKGGIGALSTTVAGIRESAERGEKKTDELGRTVAERLQNAETTLGGISEILSLMTEKLDRLEADGDEKRKLRIVMNAEVDMLYSVFMTSALPQYQKDEIGLRIAKMREVLANDEK